MVDVVLFTIISILVGYSFRLISRIGLQSLSFHHTTSVLVDLRGESS